MKNYLYRSGFLAIFASVLFTSCDPEIDAPSASSGEADFSTYVALGNSLTAGFQDGALYREGQINSYPAILADQFELVGGNSAFKQPLMPEGLSLGSPRPNSQGQFETPQRRVLAPAQDCLGVTSLSPTEAGAPGAYPTAFLGSAPTEQGPYNNLGVPGAKSFHLLAPGYGNPAGLATGTANPFYARFATSTSSSVLGDALAQNPTFFTLWIGNNDVLGYALAGGVPMPGEREYPTDKNAFTAYINALLSQLTANGAEGAVGNIPDITKVPFFTTVPYNGLMLTAEQATQLTAAYGGQVTFKAGSNPFIIREDGVTRPIKSTEYILLTVPQNQLKCQGLGSITPIDDKFVISEAELATIRDFTASYNSTLKTTANNLGLAYADFNAYMDRVSTGLTMNGVRYNSSFVTGNVFSLDGIHFTPRGAALVANEFIDVINKTYNARVPKVDETQYRAVLFP